MKKQILFYIVVGMIVFAGVAILNIAEQIKINPQNENILEPKRIEFLEKIPGFYLKDALYKADGSYVYIFEVKYSAIDKTPIEIIAVSIPGQYYFIFLKKNKIEIHWSDKDSGIEYEITADNKRIKFNSSLMDRERAEKLYERGISWVLEVRRYFGVETPDGLKKAVEKQKNERFDFK